MKKLLKFFGLFVGAILVLGLVVAAFNIDRLKRLHAVNTLFSEDKIISNFSNMKGAFAFSPIVDSGDLEKWERAIKPLPANYTQNGASKSVKEWMLESKTTSLVVIKNGKLTFDEYYLGTKPDDLRMSWSVGKSFLSAALGIAVEDGLIELSKPVDHYVPALKDSAYRGVTIRNVLNMSSGVRFDENYLDFWSDIKKMGRVLALGGSMDEFAASIKVRDREQGVARQYVSIDTHILSMALRAATGKRLGAYLGEKIISPIGFSKAPYYTTDSEGNAFALGGLNVTSLDFARFGQMILNGGRWHGKQIVPAKWIAESTVNSAKAPANGDGWGYGYQWWIPPSSLENGGDFVGRGVYGQYIYINPKTATVIVRTAANLGFRKLRGDDSTAHQNNVAMFRAIAAQ